MKNLQSYKYYGTTDLMSQQEAYRCAKYLKQHRASLVAHGRLLIDTKALLTPCNLDCFRCHLVHRETCCENGQPYAMEEWQSKRLEEVADPVIRKYMQGSAGERLMQSGIWDQAKGRGNIQQYRGSCGFLTEVNGSRCCAIHAYAVQENQEVYPVKPFSCQLYPVELIQVGEQILVTALDEETASFSRWGADYLESFYCSNLSRRKAAKHLDEALFALEAYQPAYRWGKYIIENALGKEAYEAVEAAVELEYHSQREK